MSQQHCALLRSFEQRMSLQSVRCTDELTGQVYAAQLLCELHGQAFVEGMLSYKDQIRFANPSGVCVVGSCLVSRSERSGF